MRTLKFRFWKDKKLQGILELKQNSILDMGWEWDKVDQFTGLLDKSGKEIFEGDKLDYGFKTPGFTELYKGKVFFEDGMFLIDGDRFNEEYHLLNKCCYLKIIGNIYENLELTKEQ